MDFALEKKAGTMKYERMMKNALDAFHRDGELTEHNCSPWYVQNKTEMEESERKNRRFSQQEHGTTCPKCGAELIPRSGKYGFFIGCSSFPDCRYSRSRW